MVFPIPLGTTLQNRYCLIDLNTLDKLQRSYLAKDLQQQNQLCTVLEITLPEIPDLSTFRKRFHAEVENLSRLRHPQLPRLYTSFEEDDRLFLIHDYIEGKTIYSQRSATKTAWNEVEVIRLLLQLLPVIEYLHSHGFIHGQIKPENIIQPAITGHITPETTLLPVLINLNVVCQLINRLLPDHPETQLLPETDVSNDLYDLAITAVILLTGLSKSELLDTSGQLRWDWQTLTSISLELGQILNRTLSYQPGVPYHSAKELREALETLSQPSERVTSIAEKPPTKKSINVAGKWGSIWAYLFSILLFGGVWAGIWFVLNELLNPDAPQLLPDKLPVFNNPTPALKPAIKPTTPPVVLKLSPQGKISVEGSLKERESLVYQISAKSGQQLNASVADKGVSMIVLNSKREPLYNQTQPVQRYLGPLFSEGEYFIQLMPVSNSPLSKYKLNVNISSYFPKKICQDSPTEKTENWYPVFVQYTLEKLETINSKYCRNTFIIPASGTAGPLVEVASFASLDKAKAFAELMQNQLGSGEVGKAAKTPKTSCSDADGRGEKTFYPVFVEYSKEKYDRILSFCPTASVTDRPARLGTYIEVAAFLDRSKAEQLAGFINQEVGDAQVGEPTQRNPAQLNQEK